MTRWNLLPWLLLALWAVWLHALQGLLGRHLGPWTPDLGLVFLLALAARLQHEELPVLALVVGLARCSLSVDPPAAILAGMLAVGALSRVARGMLELEAAGARTLLAVLCAWMLATWLEQVQRVHLADAAALPGFSPLTHWRLAVMTGAGALALAPLFARLPGLTPLRRRRAWPRAVSARWS